MPPSRIRPKNAETDSIQREIGRRIRAARTKAGKSQEAVSGAADIEIKRYQRLEAGQVNATLNTIARVATALEIDFWSLIGARPPADSAKRKS